MDTQERVWGERDLHAMLVRVMRSLPVEQQILAMNQDADLAIWWPVQKERISQLRKLQATAKGKLTGDELQALCLEFAESLR